MEKGEKVSAEIRLDSNRSLKVKGKIKDTRKVFGREEFLIKVDKVDPIWITEEKLVKA